MQIRVQTDADHIKEEDRGGGGGSYNLAGELDAAAAAEGINLNAAGRKGKEGEISYIRTCISCIVVVYPW